MNTEHVGLLILVSYRNQRKIFCFTYTVVNVVVKATMEQALLILHFLLALIIQVKHKKVEHHSLTDFSN